MTTMQLELPMLTIAKQNQLNYESDAKNSCRNFYKTKRLVGDDDASKLCSKSTYFTFKNTFESSVALTNMYLYQDIFNSKYAEDYANTLGIEISSLSDLMRSDDSSYKYWFIDLYDQVSLHYK